MSYEISKNYPCVGYSRCDNYVIKFIILRPNKKHRVSDVDTCKDRFYTSQVLVQEIFNLDGSISNVSKIKCYNHVINFINFEPNNKSDFDTCKEYTKFRTSKVLVREILYLDGSISNISKVKCDSDFVYTKGGVVADYDYVEAVDFDTKVCSQGIHYFLSFEAAKFD